jgi:magnesium transporter
MLINCAAYQEGKKLTEIPKAEIASWLQKPGCFVWVALVDPDATELNEMKAQFGLHELAVEDALVGGQRPKLEEYGDSLFTVVQTFEFLGGDLHAGELDIFAGPNYVLSCRRNSEKGFMEVRARCEREPQLLRHGSGYVLYALMDAVVDRYFPVLEKLEGDLEALEERIFANDSSARANIQALYELKQKLGIVKHATGPQLEVMGKLFGGRVPMVCSNLGEYFRDIYDHLMRLNQSIDTARDTISTAISVNLSMIALQENETTKKLAGYAALIAIPTLIVGIYGMNFEHMPELHWTYGYPLALGLMASIDFYLYYLFRKSRWL